ncbi:MAG: hypothetical protein ACJ0UT_04545 [Candidatus Latescibacterota bacterium]
MMKQRMMPDGAKLTLQHNPNRSIRVEKLGNSIADTLQRLSLDATPPFS